MAVIRVEKTRDYTTMSNFHLRDKRLSLKAVGLLSKILSLPPDWDYTVAGLAGICKEGRGSIGTTLEELEAAGYIIRRQVHKEDGTFGGNEYVVFEQPPPTVVGKADNGETPEMSTVARKPGNGAQPLPENPSTVFPSTDNPAQLNTYRSSTEYSNPPIVPPQGDGPAPKAGKKKEAPAWKPDRFAAFWKAYPRKESKQRTISAWDKLRPSDDLLVVMAVALKRQMSSDQWTRDRGRYIPYPASWLNQRRWEDEPMGSASSPPGGWAEDREVL